MAERIFRTSNAPTLGMRGTHTWTANEKPDSFHEMILWLYPNGAAPLTAMLSKLKKVKESEPHFHWWTSKLPDKGITIASVYTDAALTTPVSAGAVGAGSVLYVPLSADFSKQMRAGHQGLLRQTTLHSEDINVKVIEVFRGTDTTSYAKCVTLAARTLTGVPNRFICIGNINPEGSVRPAAYSFNTTEYGNQQQIFRTALAQTRTDMGRKGRIGDSYKELKRGALEDHSIEMEWAFMFGEQSWNLGDNGMPERTTQGIVPFVRQYASSNVMDCARDSDFAGAAWDDFGIEALEKAIQQSFKWGKAKEKVVFCGAGALAGVQKAVKGASTYNIEAGTAQYGIQVVSLQSVFGKWQLILHPLWTHEPSQTNSLLAFEPSQLEYRFALDTKFEEDIHYGKGGGTGLDGKEEGYITEAGLSFYHPELFLYMENVGQDSLLSS